jgi:4a-hydroxytetrahydrobiopterin dehydratase
MATMSAGEVQSALAGLPGWAGDAMAIRKTFTFPSFPAAIAFVNRAAELAEQAQHHPDIDIRYNRVTMTLSTHDAGGVTEKDLDLARKLESAAAG